MELNLVHDKAKIFGKEVPLQNTSSGHYIVSMKETLIPIEQSLFISQDIIEKEKNGNQVAQAVRSSFCEMYKNSV